MISHYLHFCNQYVYSTSLNAQQTLKKGKECVLTEPLAAEILLNTWAAQDETTVMEAIRQHNRVCNRVNFPLSQYTSNDASILTEIPEENKISNMMEIGEDSIKILDVKWNPQHDTFSFECNFQLKNGEELTKKTICSKIAAIFDPEALLLPYKMNILVTTIRQRAKIKII